MHLEGETEHEQFDDMGKSELQDKEIPKYRATCGRNAMSYND